MPVKAKIVILFLTLHIVGDANAFDATQTENFIHSDSDNLSRPRGYKTFFMFNSAEHEIFPSHKC